VSKLIKNFCLKFIANSGVIFVLILFSSFQPPGVKSYGLTKVVIDAGHGGHDSGCLGKKAKEKDVALGIALKLGKFIEDHYPEVKVIYTRKTDEFVELYERAQIANNAKADLFICIHCNSACVFDKKKKKETCNQEIEGVESWVMGLNKSEANLEVSKRENEVILLEKDYTSQYDGFDPNSPEANIIFSLYQNTYLEQSLRMATLVQQEVKSKGRPGRGVKQAGFLVLYKTFMPSILIETGFLSNDKEEKFLASSKGQEDIASAIFRAFQQYKGSIESAKLQENEKPAEKQNDKSSVKQSEKQGDSVSQQPEVRKSDSIVKPEEKRPVTQNEKMPAKSAEPVSKPPTQDSAGDKNALGNGDSNADNVLQWSVQFYTAAKAIPDNHKVYKNFDDVREEFEGGVYKYSTGLFSTRDEAIKLQNKIRAMGYKDAFVVAFYNNKKIPMKDAIEMSQKKIN
jgi:N-acetylmuramoyl-L-alanine amidase